MKKKKKRLREVSGLSTVTQLARGRVRTKRRSSDSKDLTFKRCHPPALLSSSLPSPPSSLTFLCIFSGRITRTQENIQYNVNQSAALSEFSRSKRTCVTSIQIGMQNSSSTPEDLGDPFPSLLPPEKVTIILTSKTRRYLAFLKTIRKWNIQNLGFCARFLVLTAVSLRLPGGGGGVVCPFHTCSPFLLQFGGHYEESGTLLYVAFGERRSQFCWVCT